MNKTKIVATIGPSSCSKDVLKELIKNGLDVARINLKHATKQFCIDVKKAIDEINVELDKNVALMFDTRGPEIRIGRFHGGEAEFLQGTKIRIYMEELAGDSTKFSINYPSLLEEIRFDALIKLNDGKVVLKVLDKGNDYLLCEVLVGGVLTDNKGANIVDHRLNRPFLSHQDKLDIKFANDLNVDFIALSFVETYENILDVNDLLISMGNDHIGIIAKIENSSAVEDIDNIISSCDGIMIARGDLGVELPIERVPGIQKQIITKCHIEGKVSIVATEMMSSMETSKTPTRAEVSDVANAVLDGADAVMLSGETTIGKYPVETVQTIEKILEQAELDLDYDMFTDRAKRSLEKDITSMIANNVAESAKALKCKAIFAPTMSGHTPKKISRFRPICPIIAASPNELTVKSLQLHFGVLPILIDELKTFEKIISVSKKITNDIVEINQGDNYIITGGFPFKDTKHTNFMKIEEM